MLSHPDKILFPEVGISKSDLAEYYTEVSRLMLPHLQHRPLSLLSCPGGRATCFFQKHLTAATKLGIPQIAIRDKSGARKNYSYVESVDHLISLVQLNALEIHPWNAGIENVEKPDRLVFDLDPGPGVSERALVSAALVVRDLLREAGIRSFPRVSGGKGVHVVAALQPLYSWSQVKEFARLIAMVLQENDPTRYIAKMSKAERVGRIFVDYLRNERGATAIANYSTRAREGAPVAVPLTWDEIADSKSLPRFSIRDVVKRVKAQSKDPWDEMLRKPQKLPASALKA